MENSLQLAYVLCLVVLLAVSAGLVIRQVLRTRATETTLNRLQNQVTQGDTDPEALYELGGIYLRKKLYGQAAGYLQKALRSWPEEDAAGRARVCNALGYACFAQDQYDVAIRHYRDALKVLPDYVTAWNNLGHAYEKKKLTAQALEAYDQALAQDGTNSTARRRAEALRKRLAPTA